MTYVHRTERVNDLIVQIVADEGGVMDNPYKEYDQTSEVFGEYRNLDIDAPPDEHLRILERGGLRMLYRYMRRFGDPRDGSKLLAIKQLGCYEHSGITVFTEEIGNRKDLPFDPGGWDTSRIGYVMISKSRWDEINGGDPDAEVDDVVTVGLGRIPVKMTAAYSILKAEVKEWDDWLRGNVWGYVVTKPCDDHGDDMPLESVVDCPHSETVDSVWGYIGDPDESGIWSEATSAAEAH